MIPFENVAVTGILEALDFDLTSLMSKAHHYEVRTTLLLDSDAIEAIKAYAKANDVSMGKAASELIRRGVKFRLGVRMVNDIPVLDAPADFPAISPGMVSEVLDEE